MGSSGKGRVWGGDGGGVRGEVGGEIGSYATSVPDWGGGILPEQLFPPRGACTGDLLS